MLKGFIQEKEDQTYQQLNFKRKKKANSKQLEQEHNHRNGDHMEGDQWREEGGRTGEKVQGIRSTDGRYKIGAG